MRVRDLFRFLGWLSLLPLAAFLALQVHSRLLDFPDVLQAKEEGGLRIVDRDGLLLARTMAKDGVFRAPFSLNDAGPHLKSAMLAAEDKRFYSHGGIDLWAIARAGVQLLIHGRPVSGASTITQQLARSTFERPRTVWGKWREMALALCIERELSKDEILEAYLNRVDFGPNIVGASAAADHFFGKPLAALSLSEAATLAGLVRGPSLYDPRVRPDLTERRRDRVLHRMVNAGFARASEVAPALSLSVHLLPRPPLPGAKHWVRKVGKSSQSELVRTTLVGTLQRQVETLVAERAQNLRGRQVGAASVVVLDNENGDVLAWVGSPDFDEESAGQNDGILARRQPGSTLKPFLYAMGIEELGLTTASLLPDEPTQFRTPDSFYAPQNFDRTFRGVVPLRRALSNSLNVPAVHVLSRLGIGHALVRLREFGLSSLDRDADHYGPALALGDGEVTLLELASAYAVLARQGRSVAPRFLLDDPVSEGKRVLSPEASALIAEVLSNDVARRESFGAHNALDLPFSVAVKTGTSKGYRDSWTIGYTRSVTVGVWVGNFDGSPTERVTGARGAGPLFHQVMKITHDEWEEKSAPAPAGSRPLHDVPLEQVSLCSRGVNVPCAADERPVLYWMTQAQLKEEGVAHAQAFGRMGSGARGMDEGPLVTFPSDGMVFDHDPAIPEARQRLVFRASGSSERLTMLLDGQPLPTLGGRTEWVMAPGRHQLIARAGDEESPAIQFQVR